MEFGLLQAFFIAHNSPLFDPLQVLVSRQKVACVYPISAYALPFFLRFSCKFKGSRQTARVTYFRTYNISSEVSMISRLNSQR